MKRKTWKTTCKNCDKDIYDSGLHNIYYDMDNERCVDFFCSEKCAEEYFLSSLYNTTKSDVIDYGEEIELDSNGSLESSYN